MPDMHYKTLSVSRPIVSAEWIMPVIVEVKRQYGQTAIMMTKRDNIRMHLVRRKDVQQLPHGRAESRRAYSQRIAAVMPASFLEPIPRVTVTGLTVFSSQHTGIVYAMLQPTEELQSEHEALNGLLSLSSVPHDERSNFMYQVGIGQVMTRISKRHKEELAAFLPPAIELSAGEVSVNGV